jgi:hypothetical protein
MLQVPAGRLEFLLIKDGPHPSDCREGAEGLAKGTSLGHRTSRPGDGGELSHNVPDCRNKVGDNVGVPQRIISLDVVEGDVVLYHHSH